MFNDLLDEDPFIQEKKAEGEAKGHAAGLAEGEVKGEAIGLQKGIVAMVDARFPSLVELAQKKVKRVHKPDALLLVLRGIGVAPDESSARMLLDLLIA